MRELALNVLDIAENSVTAHATEIDIDIRVEKNILSIVIKDNGCGMTEEFVKKVVDPFSTTRTTRKVGMGIPLFKLASEAAGGKFDIRSKSGIGTTVTATFEIDNIDRAPLGNIASTISQLIATSPEIRFVFNYSIEGNGFSVDTDEVKENIGDVPITEYEILKFIEEMINENMTALNGGIDL